MKKIFSALLFFALLLFWGFSGFSQCNTEEPASHGIHPGTLPEGALNQNYPATWITVAFRKDTVIKVDTIVNRIPIRTSFTVKFTEYQLDSTGGVPRGMDIQLGTCNARDCRYTIDQVNTANNRGCLQITGTPNQGGNFRPFIRALASGTFPMPNLGALNQIIGIPAGTVIDIANPPAALANQVRPLRETYFRTNLRISGGSGSSCDSRPRYQGLYPKPMPDGLEGENYPETKLTFVYRSDTTIKIDTIIQFPGAPFPFAINTSVTINFTNYQVDSAGGFPDELKVDLSSCDRPECNYDVDKQVAENNRGCLTLLAGRPAYPNLYRPFLSLLASGNFKMPNLGIPIPIPGLPPPGTEIDLANPPPLLAGFIAPLRTIRISTELTIRNKTNVPLCNNNIPQSPGLLQPDPMPEGKVGVTYNPATMTLDLPQDSLVTTGQGQQFLVQFESFRLVGVEGLPKGMGFDLDTCEITSNCVYRVNRLDLARNRLCFKSYGSPTEPGLYTPLLFFQAEGTVQFFGNTFNLSNLPAQLEGALAGIRNIRFATNLRVEPDRYTQLCNPEKAVSKGLLSPMRLADADSGSVTPYSAKLTLDFPQDTVVRIAGQQGAPGTSFRVFYQAFTVERSEGLPPGMQLRGLCPAVPPCKYELNNLDTARNRICFTIDGTPTRAGQYQPGVVATGEGVVVLAGGQTFPLNNLPNAIPQNLRTAIESVRVRKFTTNLRVKGGGVSREETLKNQYQALLYPNPSGSKTTLKFYLAAPASSRLQVTDLNGKTIYKTALQNLNPGEHSLTLDIPHLPSGIYFIRLTINKDELTQKWIVE